MAGDKGLISEWMWRFLAAVMLFTLGWMLWILYQLNPPPLIMDAAFEAFARSKAKQSGGQSTQGVITTPAPAAEAAPAAVVAVEPSPEKIAEEKAAADKAAAEKAAAEKLAADKAAAEKAAAAKPDPAEVIAALEAWAKAWSARDVAGYLAAYAPDFKPPGGESRAEWEKVRRQRVSAPRSISVTIDTPKVRVVSNDNVSVTFRQTYKSDIVPAGTDTKTLVLVRSNGRWLIQQENSND